MSGRIQWGVHTEGAGPEAVLLLHGFTGSHQDWDEVTAALALEYTVVRPDLPGHGETKAEPGAAAMPEVARGLVGIMENLGFPRFHLAGYSMGGRTALALACTYPERVHRLVLESASPGLRTAEERAARRQSDADLADRIVRNGIYTFVAEWERIPLFASQQRLSGEVLQRQRAVRLRQAPAGLAQSLREMGTGNQPSYWSQLGRVQVPTLLVTGALDDKFCGIADAMERSLPSARHVVVPEAGHNVHLEQPRVYIRMLVDHLKGRAHS